MSESIQKFRCEGCDKDYTLEELEVIVTDLEGGGKQFSYFRFKALNNQLLGFVTVTLEALCPNCESTLATANVETDYQKSPVKEWKTD